LRIVKQPTSHLVFSRRSPKIRSSQRKRKPLIFLSRVAVNQATGSIIVLNIATTIKATDAIVTIANPTIVIETINATIALDMTISLKEHQAEIRKSWSQLHS
jgi:hypothetical protein